MSGLSLPEQFPVTCHTQYVGPGSTFVAIKGLHEDGAYYIPKAIAKGATRIVIAKDAAIPSDIVHIIERSDISIERVDNTRAALAHLSAQAAHYPAHQLKIIGVTGTKGKTTTTFLLAHLLSEAGYKTAMISTIKNAINSHDFSSSLTTPQPDYLHQFLKLCVDTRIQYVVMEVAAQALSLQRTADLMFDGVIFTNFSHEHLEFYLSLSDYFQAKCLIFNQVKKGAPVLVNADDDWCQTLKLSSDIATWFGMHDARDITGTISGEVLDHLLLSVQYNNHTNRFSCPSLMGEYNAYNALAAIGFALKIDIDPVIIASALQSFPGVSGRLERFVMPNSAQCIIDYAHNPASYHAVLSLLRLQTNQLIVVFGAGGGRDIKKRSAMGRLAAKFADVVLVTSDNPRLEDPNKIITDIIGGIPSEQIHKVIRDLDREQAIVRAYALSRSGSIIAILGKGTNEYQIIGKVKSYFSEREIIKQLQ